jgi:hypothetical protein
MDTTPPERQWLSLFCLPALLLLFLNRVAFFAVFNLGLWACQVDAQCMDAYAENLNNNGLENRWGLVDSARLYLLPTIKGRSECEGNGRGTEESAGRWILPSCQFSHPGRREKWQKWQWRPFMDSISSW